MSINLKVILSRLFIFRLIGFTIFLFIVHHLFSQRVPIPVISVNDILAKTQIFDIEEDQNGFIWIGTRDGLIRYDGREVKLFDARTSEEDSFTFNYCRDMLIHSDGSLWLASSTDFQGLGRIDTRTYEFEKFNHDPTNPKSLGDNAPVALCEDSQGRVVSISKGLILSIYNIESGNFENFNLAELIDLPVERGDVFDIIEDPNFKSFYWIATLGSVIRFDANLGRIDRRILALGGSPRAFFINPDNSDILWIGTTAGLASVSILEDSIITFFNLYQKNEFLNNQFTRQQKGSLQINDIIRKSKNELWIATTNQSLLIFDIQNEKFIKTNISHDGLIRTIFRDKNDNLWIGSDKAGLLSLLNDEDIFSLHLIDDGLDGNAQFRMNAISMWKEDEIFMGFHRDRHLWKWNSKEDTYTKTPLPESNFYVTSIKTKNSNDFILTTNGGIYNFDAIKNHLELSANSPENLETANYHHLLTDSFGNDWYNVWNYGLVKSSETGDRHFIYGNETHAILHPWVHDMTFASDGKLWVAQEAGLSVIDPETEEVEHRARIQALNGFVSPDFNAITPDHFGRLWVSNFGRGISCFNPSLPPDQAIYHMTMRNGLPSDRIYDMITDLSGDIWIWTSRGLVMLTPKENIPSTKITYYPETFSFPIGRVGTWFYLLDNGEIYFGVIGGFVRFHPDSIKNNKLDFPKPPIITSIKVFDQEVLPELLPSDEREVVFQSDQNFFDIAFSTPDFNKKKQLRYSYKMEGVNKDWVTCIDCSPVQFTNLNPGNYQFFVRSSGQDESWSAISQTMNIRISPPWYSSSAAQLFYLLMALTILFLIYRSIIMRERIKGQLAIKGMEARSLQELDHEKSKFFAQISHEFRTPLTIIMGMVDELRERINPSATSAINAIERNSEVLLTQINQILELSKLESKVIKLHNVHGELVGFTKYLLEAYRAYAVHSGIQLNYSSGSNEIWMDFDPEKLKTVLSNLISNALKFTKHKGSINVSTVEKQIDDNKFVVISISDTGPGIRVEDRKRIFDPYFHGSENGDGVSTGLGLALAQQWTEAMGGRIDVETKLEEGATFIITLPITSVSEEKFENITEIDPGTNNKNVGPQIAPSNNDKDNLPQLLLVEDNEEVMSFLTTILKDSYQIIAGRDGTEGLHLAREQVPDIIISDVMMPKMDGNEFTALLRKDELTNHIPIILLTAKAAQEDMLEGIAHGADVYLTKPFNKAELLLRLKKLLEQRAVLQKKYIEQGLAGMVPGKVISVQNIDPILSSIQTYLTSHLDKDFSIEELATTMNISRVQLYRKVKAMTGRSISGYIRFIRLCKAKVLLNTKSFNVSEVAYQVGFADPNYFSKCFTEEFGIRPSEFAQKPE